jgi:hypothetical protein
MMLHMRLMLVVLASLALAPSAAAQEVTMEPAELVIGTTTEVTFKLKLPEGTWSIKADVPGWVQGVGAFGSSDPLTPYGSPFTPGGPPVVSAGGTVSGGGPGTDTLVGNCRRGFSDPTGDFTTVTIPAGGGMVAWGFYLSRAQRWSATDYRVSFRIAQGSAAPLTVRPAAPVVRGRFGTRFIMRMRRTRGTYLISGATQPVLSRGRVSLMTARAKDTAGPIPAFPEDFTQGRPVVTLRTDSRGRFSYRWRPRRNFYYALWAGSFNERGRLGDSSCPLRVDTGS